MSKRQATSPFAVRTQARATRARLAEDHYLREVERMYAYLMGILRKHLTVTVGGKRIKVKLEQSANDWWWLHYKSLFYFALVAKKLDWKTPKSKKMLEVRAKALAATASLLAMDNLGEKAPFTPRIDDDVACFASKIADCPPKGALRPMQDFCN
jgi:hypothetical protein